MDTRVAFHRAEVSATEPDPQWAWQPFEPRTGWNLRWAGHLLRRIGFGPTWSELQEALSLGPQKTVDQLLKTPPDAEDFTTRMDQWESSANTLPAIRAWWLRRMLETPQPLVEKMTLFWHGHLALGNVRTPSNSLTQDYLRTLRRHALGRWDALLRAAVLHPAMLVSLGGEANRKARPSVHVAQVLLEHFTVGPGQFQQKDVEESARALTGWFVLRDQLRFIDREFDPGPKNLFGRSGPLDADELFRLLASLPATAKFLIRKLYRYFISEAHEPSDALLEPLVTALVKGEPIGRLVEIMLRSNLFFSAAAYRGRVKSPVEWTLSILRPMETLVPTEPLSHTLEELGQALGTPPTPAGWPGGPAWIPPAMLLARAQWAEQCWGPQSPYGQKLDPAAIAEKHKFRSPAAQADFLLKLYLQDDLPQPIRTKLLEETQTAARQNPSVGLRRLAQTLVLLPEFQLG